MPTRDQLIASYKRERAHYVAHGNEDRVRQVDEELARLQADADADGAEDEVPQGRSGPEADQQTADTGSPQQTGDAGAAAKAPAKKTAAKKTTPPTQK